MSIISTITDANAPETIAPRLPKIPIIPRIMAIILAQFFPLRSPHPMTSSTIPSINNTADAAPARAPNRGIFARNPDTAVNTTPPIIDPIPPIKYKIETTVTPVGLSAILSKDVIDN